jgi:hypothetical protein
MCTTHTFASIANCIALGALVMGGLVVPMSIRGATPAERYYAWSVVGIYASIAVGAGFIAVMIASLS